MTATFDDLSSELLVKIFSYYIASEGHVQFSRKIFPVCSKWRNVSQTPSLWKRVRLHIRYYDYLCSFSNRGLLQHTQKLNLPGNWSRTLLDPYSLGQVLSKINDLKWLKLSYHYFGKNMMAIVAEHCPNLERLCIKYETFVERVKVHPDPYLGIFEPEYKQPDLTLRDVEDSEEMISVIAAKCKSLQVFEWHGDNSKFPIYKIMSGCSRLRKLLLFKSKFVTTGGDCSGFTDLAVFEAHLCDFDGLELCSLLKYAYNLEHLKLFLNRDFSFKDISQIPSNKLRFLSMHLDYFDSHFVALDQIVDRWKHTLLCLDINRWEYNLTSVLKTYLNGNKCPKLEVLKLPEKGPSEKYLKTFIEKCPNLKELEVHGKLHLNHEEIKFIKFLNPV